MNSSSPLISIIIPAYNAEKYIEETLKSVYEQNYENWECIIVNDGSTDNTLSIINKWIEKDQRFSVFNKKNEGLSKARNSGIALAKSDFIALLDSDDVWMPHHLSSLIEKMLIYNVDIVYSYAYRLYTNHNNTTIVQDSDTEKINGLQVGKNCIENFLDSNKIFVSFVLCNKSTLINNNNFSYLKKAEDYHTWIKLLCNGATFYSLNIPTGYYRIVENSMSSVDRICSKEIIEIISIFKDQIKKYDIDYYHYFKLWIRKYFLIKDSKEHYIEAINYIHSIDKSFFPIFRHITPLLPKKVLKILTLFLLKRY